MFVPEVAAHCGLEAVYRDEAIVTKHDAHGVPVSSSSQPAIMASMLERLDLREGQRVLEVGTGTGYNAALIAEIVGPRGDVVSVELDPDLARRARSVLQQAGYRVRSSPATDAQAGLRAPVGCQKPVRVPRNGDFAGGKAESDAHFQPTNSIRSNHVTRCKFCVLV
jgi:protein-L-isoaspartate O-methyltransferase